VTAGRIPAILYFMIRRLMVLALFAPVAMAQVAVGRIEGHTRYSPSVKGYVAIFDLWSGKFTPLVTQLDAGCRSKGDGQVMMRPTKTFSEDNHTLLAITANTGPASSGGCGTPAGVAIDDGLLVNPGQTAGPVLYFTNKTSAAISDGVVPLGIRWAVAGSTNTNNDCPDPFQIGTLLVKNGQPGACAIPKSMKAAGRGAAGLNSTGQFLIIAVVEGSDSGGLRTSDLAELMIGLQATNAVNFDGGGSTVFYWRPSPVPATSAQATRMLELAQYPKGRSNPNEFAFSVIPRPTQEPETYDSSVRSGDNPRPIYISLGFTYAP